MNTWQSHSKGTSPADSEKGYDIIPLAVAARIV